MRKIIFLGIKFIDISDNDFEQIINNNGLFLFPSGPGLSTILSQKEYHRSLKKADFVFFDSGFFVLLLYIFKKIKVNKFSGYKFIRSEESRVWKECGEWCLCGGWADYL